MKAIIVHSPYWKTQGGGERYALTAARCLRSHAQVFISLPTLAAINELSSQLNIDATGINPLPQLPGSWDLRRFFGVFWVSDGSIPFLPVRHRVIHFQAPFRQVTGKSVKNRLKLFGTKVVCNSLYTKTFIDQEFDIKSTVVYPPVEVAKIPVRKKHNLILSVGRFSTSSQLKRPEVLINAFKTMVDKGLSNWRLVIAGRAEDEASMEIVASLRRAIRTYPIAIKTDLDHRTLVELYRKAAIYWHAAGYGADLTHHPEQAEHFGISTVEAMAGGAVPLAYAAGGQVEIIHDNKDGGLWRTTDELIAKTRHLIDNPEFRQELSKAASKRSKAFSTDRFCQEITNLFL